MHTFSIYTPFDDWSPGEPPVTPFLHLSVAASFVEGRYALLSAQLMSNTEIDETVDALKLDLESFRENAKLKLRELQRKVLEG